MLQNANFNILISEVDSQKSARISRYMQGQSEFQVTVVQTAENLLSALVEGNGVGKDRFDILLLSDALPSLKNNKPIKKIQF